MKKLSQTVLRLRAAAQSRRYYRRNRRACRVRHDAWLMANRDQQKAYRKRNRKRFADYAKKYRATHRAERNRQLKLRRKRDVRFRMIGLLRSRVGLALKGKLKSARTQELLGCTISELRAHLETLFQPGMTWNNYGQKWHIDHKRPCAQFDLSDSAQQLLCFNWKNLQPLWAKQNQEKGAKCPA